jgi:hypothetical protein
VATSGKPSGASKRERFVRALIDSFRRAGEAEIAYDADDFTLTVRGEKFRLATAEYDYWAAPPAHRPAVLQKYVRLARGIATGANALPGDFAAARPRLLPWIHDHSTYRGPLLALSAPSPEERDYPHRPLVPGLVVNVKYTTPDYFRSLEERDFRQWGVSFAEAFAAALDNLRPLATPRLRAQARGVYVSTWQDNLDPSRLLLEDFVRAHEVKGDPVALLPNWDHLILTGTQDREGLAEMLRLAELAWRPRGPISNVPIRLEDGRWLPCAPDAAYPDLAGFRRLRLEELAAAYERQKQLLIEHLDEPLIVADHHLVRDKGSGALVSCCTWTQDKWTLLPEAENVSFERDISESEGHCLACADWGRVRAVVGDLMTPLGIQPERYLVQRFPSAAQLGELGFNRLVGFDRPTVLRKSGGRVSPAGPVN